MFVKECIIRKLFLNLHNNNCNDIALVLCNNGLFCLFFLSVLLILKLIKAGDVSHISLNKLFSLVSFCFPLLTNFQRNSESKKESSFPITILG